MDRRPLDIHIAVVGVWADEAVEVARLELVGVPDQRLKVANAEVAGASLELGAKREDAQGRVAACTPAGDGEAIAVHEAALCEETGTVDAIVDVDDPPLAVQPFAVTPTVAGAPAVVDVQHRDATTGPILPVRRVGRARGRGWTTVAHHQQRRLLALWGDGVTVLRSIEKGVSREAVLGGELNRLRRREVGLVCDGARTPLHDIECPGRQVEVHQHGCQRRRRGREECVPRRRFETTKRREWLTELGRPVSYRLGR